MIEIITDSTSDITPAEAKELGVRVLPLTVQFAEETFRDGVDISNGDFYARLRTARILPTTSQINPDVFVKEFEQALERGSQVVGIFVSSELSGTVQSALIAKEMLDSQDIFVIDSRQVALSLKLLVIEAVRLSKQGCAAEELARKVTEMRGKVRLYAVVDTLKYLKMGGRISSATAMVGGVLGVTPIVTVHEGKVEAVGKTRGRKAGVQWILRRVQEEEPDFSRGLALGHTDCMEALNTMKDEFSDMITSFAEVSDGDIGAVVGTHVGPGAAGIAYFIK